MPSRNDVFQEMVLAGQAAIPPIPVDFDSVLKAKMRAIEEITHRPLVVYAVDMSNPAKTANNPISGLINYDDKDAFIEATQGIAGDELDILLHSPGGLAEAAESIVALLRAQFKHIRYIVPSMAKSAATMLALSGNEIIVGVSSELGPIDPQMQTGRGFAPAQAILDQFKQAQSELKADPSALPAWLPILQQYGPSLLQECNHHIALSERLVSTWLAAYMFNGDADRDQHAKDVAAKLNDHALWLSHSRRVDLNWLANDARLKVTDLDSQPVLAEAVHALHIALGIVFGVGTAFKIVQNAHGGAYVGHAQMMNIQLVQPQGAPASQPSPPPGSQTPGTPSAPTNPLPPAQPTPPHPFLGRRSGQPNRSERRGKKSR